MNKAKQKRSFLVICVVIFLILAMTLAGVLLQCAGPEAPKEKSRIEFTDEKDIVF